MLPARRDPSLPTRTPLLFTQVFDAVYVYDYSREAYDTEFSYLWEIIRIVHMLRAVPPPFALQLSADPAPFYPAPAANPFLALAVPPAAAAVAVAPPAAAVVAAADVDTEESDSDTTVNSLLAM